MVYNILHEGIILYSLQAKTNKITYIKHNQARQYGPVFT